MKKYIISAALLSVMGLWSFAETTKINYSGRSGIAPVANAEITTQINGKNFNTKFDGQGIGIAAVTQYKVKANSKGTIGSTTRPSYAQLWTSRKGKARNTEMTFGASRPQIKITPPWAPSSNKEKLNLSQLDGSIDAMTTLIRLMNQVHQQGKCYGTFNVTDGRSALQVTAKSGGTQKVSTKAYNGNTSLCQLYVKPLSGRVLRDADKGSSQVVNVYFAKVKNKEYPVAVRITGKFAGFGVSLNADSIR